MKRVMQILEPRSGWGIFARVLFFVALVVVMNVLFASFIGPHLPDHFLLYQTVHATIVGTPFVVFFMIVMVFQVRLQRHLSLLSRKDGLTGLNNRRTFLDLANRRNKEFDNCILLLLDADHFKAINDTYGHTAGDNCLKSIAYMLQRNLRDEDVIGRIGGEEFAVLLADLCIHQAQVIIERLTMPIPFQAGPEHQHLTVTLSAGAVITAREDSIDTLFAIADRALYQAKAEGRARVIFGKENMSQGALKMAV